MSRLGTGQARKKRENYNNATIRCLSISLRSSITSRLSRPDTERGSLIRIEQAPQPTNLPDLIGPAAGSTLIPCDRQDSPCVRTRTEPVFDDESLSGTAAAAIRNKDGVVR